MAKKPYNPIIGETFHCSYDVPSQKQFANSSSKSPTTTNADGTNRLFYVAEQVSHHPPSMFFFSINANFEFLALVITVSFKVMGSTNCTPFSLYFISLLSPVKIFIQVISCGFEMLRYQISSAYPPFCFFCFSRI